MKKTAENNAILGLQFGSDLLSAAVDAVPAELQAKLGMDALAMHLAKLAPTITPLDFDPELANQPLGNVDELRTLLADAGITVNDAAWLQIKSMGAMHDPDHPVGLVQTTRNELLVTSSYAGHVQAGADEKWGLELIPHDLLIRYIAANPTSAEDMLFFTHLPVSGKDSHHCEVRAGDPGFMAISGGHGEQVLLCLTLTDHSRRGAQAIETALDAPLIFARPLRDT